MSKPYNNPPFYFCTYRDQFTKVKQCSPPVGASPNLQYSPTPTQTVVTPPKKAQVYKGHKYKRSRSEILSWA